MQKQGEHSLRFTRSEVLVLQGFALEPGLSNDNAHQQAGIIRRSRELTNRSAVIASGGNARDVRTIKTDIGQFTIAQLGQLGNVALIVPEGLESCE